MTRQTSAPLQRIPLSTSPRQARWLAKQIADGEIDLDPPYQRGAVWSDDQRVALMWSLLTGTPVPSIIINDRHGAWWTDTDTYSGGGGSSYAVIDGKQRLMTMCAWFGGSLAIPASWLPQSEVLATVTTADGPYVAASGLTDLGRRMTGERIQLQVSEANLGSVREEAAVHLAVNGGGTPQSGSDMARAAEVAGGSR